MEELAQAHDTKEAELVARERELEEVREALSKAALAISGKDSEVQLARDTLAAQRKKYTEVVGALVRDVLDVGDCMSNQLQVGYLSSRSICNPISTSGAFDKPHSLSGAGELRLGRYCVIMLW